MLLGLPRQGWFDICKVGSQYLFDSVLELMSVYNGFINHGQQEKYYQLIKTLVLVLQKRILRFYQARPCNEDKFIRIIHKLITKISQLEKAKYIEPKFGDSLDQLFRELNLSSTTRFNNTHSRSSEITLNFDDKYSQASYNFQIEPLTALKKSPGKLDSSETFRMNDRKKYKSFENVRLKSIIDQTEEISRSKALRSKMAELKPFQQRLQPPKLANFIDKIKKDSSSSQNPVRRKEKKQMGEVYIGQKRRREKRVFHTLGNK